MNIQTIRSHIIKTLESSGNALRAYTYDEKNIAHLSLVLYDLMPLSVKLAVRYEKFAESFKMMFISVREHIYKDEKNEPSTKSPISSNVKIKMNLEDPQQTYDLFEKSIAANKRNKQTNSVKKVAKKPALKSAKEVEGTKAKPDTEKNEINAVKKPRQSRVKKPVSE